jgi:hypothetical protein
MSGSVVPSLVGVVVGVVSTLVTIFLTPRLQFYFWGKQHLGENRLDAIKDMNSLLADFLTQYIKNQEQTPSDNFFKSFMAASANIEALFSKKTFKVFKELEVMIGPKLGPAKGAVDIVIEARDKALRTLYREAIG